MSKDKIYTFLAVGLLVIVGIYFLYLLPKQQKAELEFEKQKYKEEQMLDLEEKININKKEEENRQGYLDCLVKGGELYQEHWKEECIRLGKKIDSSGWSCSLPKDIADSLNNSLKEGRDFCKEYYKQ
jgi:hypothetical protein